MSQPFDKTQHPEQQRQEFRQESAQEFGRELEPRQDRRQPFDNSGLDEIPQPRSDDPPYRDWWAVENGCSDGASGSTARRKQD